MIVFKVGVLFKVRQSFDVSLETKETTRAPRDPRDYNLDLLINF